MFFYKKSKNFAFLNILIILLSSFNLVKPAFIHQEDRVIRDHDTRVAFSADHLETFEECTIVDENNITSTDTISFEERVRSSFFYNGSARGNFYLKNKKSYLDFSYNLRFQLIDKDGLDLGKPIFTETKRILGGNENSRCAYEVFFDRKLSKYIRNVKVTIMIKNRKTSGGCINGVKAYHAEHPIRFYSALLVVIGIPAVIILLTVFL